MLLVHRLKRKQAMDFHQESHSVVSLALDSTEVLSGLDTETWLIVGWHKEVGVNFQTSAHSVYRAGLAALLRTQYLCGVFSYSLPLL